MARAAIASAQIVEGRTYVIQTEDGPVSTWDLFVLVTDTEGGEWVHPKSFWRTRPLDADAFLAKVEARGYIDPTLWNKQEPQMSLEERFAIYAQNEEEVRWGLRSEEDLYHGV
jgi:hypothetical protein